MKKTVCIYCGAKSGNSPELIKQSQLLAEDLARAGFNLVYGGGRDGLMRLVADIFLNHNREVVGIRPQKLVKDEAAHLGLTRLETVDDMYVRKARMIELADILIALPGGTGTLDEVMDAFSEIKLGFVEKRLHVLNSNGYYEGLQVMLNQMTDKGFLSKSDAEHLHFHNSPHSLFKKVNAYFPDPLEIDKLAYIQVENKRILTTRSKGKKSFYIPGGKREKGESDEQALTREIKEEMAVEIDIDSILYMGTFKAQADGKKTGIKVKMTCYTGDYQGVPKADNEIEEILWLEYKDMDKVSHVDKVIFNHLNQIGLM